jgi:ActR/RegA family two-component response regulator
VGDPNIENEQLANTTVFVVDDDKQTAETLRRELTQVGANVVVADSAEAALALYRLLHQT